MKPRRKKGWKSDRRRLQACEWNGSARREIDRSARPGTGCNGAAPWERMRAPKSSASGWFRGEGRLAKRTRAAKNDEAVAADDRERTQTKRDEAGAYDERRKGTGEGGEGE